MRTLVVGSGIIAYHVCQHLAVKMGRDVTLLGDGIDKDHQLLQDLPDFVIVDRDNTSQAWLQQHDFDEIVQLEGVDVIQLPAKKYVYVTPDTIYALAVKDTDNVVEPEDLDSNILTLVHAELYGPGIPGKLADLCRAALLGKPLVVGKGQRSYCMIFNLNKAIELALTAKEEPKQRTFNISDGSAPTDEGLAYAINILCNRNDSDIQNYQAARSPVILKDRQSGRLVLNITNAKTQLGYEPLDMMIGLQSLLAYTIETADELDIYTRAKLRADINFVKT